MLNLGDWVTSASLIPTKLVGWIKHDVWFLNVFESKVIWRLHCTCISVLGVLQGCLRIDPFFINILSDPKHEPTLQVFRVQARKANHLRNHQSHHSQQWHSRGLVSFLVYNLDVWLCFTHTILSGDPCWSGNLPPAWCKFVKAIAPFDTSTTRRCFFINVLMITLMIWGW